MKLSKSSYFNFLKLLKFLDIDFQLVNSQLSRQRNVFLIVTWVRTKKFLKVKLFNWSTPHLSSPWTWFETLEYVLWGEIST